MNLKAVIFDLDGTVADTLPLCIAAFRKSIEPLLGKPLSDAEIIATFGPSEEGTIRQLIPEHEEQGIKDYLLHYENLHGICPVVFPGIRELLEFFREKGLPLAMVTGKGIHSTRLSLRQFGIASYFELLETGSPNGPDKINGIRRVLEKLKVGPEESLYVGDAPSDIRYCKEIGVPIAAVAWASTANAQELIQLQPYQLFYQVDHFKTWAADLLDANSN